MICAGVLVLLSPYLDESRLRLFILPPAGAVETPAQKKARWLKLLYACRRISVMMYALTNMVGAGLARCCRHSLQNFDLLSDRGGLSREKFDSWWRWIGAGRW